jgi:predicted RNA-binding protein
VITSDVITIENKRISSYFIMSERFKKFKWTIFSRTLHKHQIKRGDICFFYLAGKMKFSQCFVAIAEIGDVKKWDDSMEFIDNPDWLLENPILFFQLNKISIFDDPVSIKPLLSKFSFIPKNRKKWGVCFMGGVRKIDVFNMKLITKELPPKIKKIFSLN